MAERRRRTSGAASGKQSGSSDIGIPGEKRVRATEKTVPVKRARRTSAGELPTEPAAIDHRRQIVGANDARGGKSRRK